MSISNTELITKEIILPPSASVPSQPTTLCCQSSLTVVGPNGAGKSRLGTWLEFAGPQKNQIHRIAAQRSLVFPESTSPVGLQLAMETFHWAPRPSNWDEQTYDSNKSSLRIQARYGGSIKNAETAPLNDFEKLVTLLFSQNYASLLNYEAAQRKTGQLVPVPESLLRDVQTLWETLLPSRKLILLGGEVRATSVADPGKDYPARAMSDGERVIFYLIGQCLCAPQKAIIVVDEPEIHLHKAIQNSLWNAIEKARSDCLFVYLTHDLTFAADRPGTEKVCLTGYENEAFSWFKVAPQQSIPEDVYLEVLGSRKPVVFVEGTYGSHDLQIYQMAYPHFTVKPIGGCAAVISATKTFRALEDMHRLKCFGIVDRDYLDAGQIESYRRAGVFVPTVAEVENLYLVPELIRAVANQLLLDAEAVLQQVTQYVLEEFQRSVPVYAIEAARHRVALGLGRFSSDELDIDVYAQSLQTYLNTIDSRAIHAAAIAEAQQLCDAKDYVGVLRVFNKKDLVKAIDRFFNIKGSTYVHKVREMSKRDIGQIPQKLGTFLPDLRGELGR